MKIEYFLSGFHFTLHPMAFNARRQNGEQTSGFECTFRTEFILVEGVVICTLNFFSQYEQKILMNENKRKEWKLGADLPRNPLQCCVVFLKTFTHSKYLNCEFKLKKTSFQKFELCQSKWNGVTWKTNTNAREAAREDEAVGAPTCRNNKSA